MQEAFLLNFCGKFSAKAASDWCLMSNDTPAGLFHGVDDSLLIPRVDSSQVNDFTRDTLLLLSHSCSHAGMSQLCAIADNSDIFTFLKDLSLHQGNFIILNGNILFSNTVKNLRLKEDHWVVVSDRGK